MTDRELFDFIDVEDMLIEMGLRNVRDTGGGEVEYSCPFPGHNHLDSRPSASMTTVERPAAEPGAYYPKTSFYCFTCHSSGTAISFLAEYENVDPLTAKRWLKERFAPEYVESGGSVADKIADILEPKPPPQPKPTQRLDRSVLDQFWINWPEVWMEWKETQDQSWALAYLFNRGFQPETLMDYDIGFDDISQRFTIPVFHADGTVAGFKGRAWWPDAFPKYKVLGGEGYGFDTYEVSRTLWGLNMAKNDIKAMLLREGELNALKLHELGYSSSVGISGKRLSKWQIDAIKEYSPDGVIIWMDELTDSFEAASHLEEFMPVWIVPQTENDPADSTPEEVEEALDGMKSSLVLRVVS